MSSVVISGDTSGAITVAAPAVAGTNTITLPAATGTTELIGVGTAVASTSGTAIDFTSIPSWAKKITVMFSGVSTSGSSNILIQIGAGSVTNTGYVSAATIPSGAVSSTAGFIVGNNTAAADTMYGSAILTTLGSNIWTEFANTYGGSGNVRSCAGGVTLSGTLDRVRITTVNGTDTFDAGNINIMWEG